MSTNGSDGIRRLSNGSMDLAFYAHRGRRLRSRAAHRSLRKMGRAMRRLWIAVSHFETRGQHFDVLRRRMLSRAVPV